MLLFAMTTLVWFFLANSFAKQGPFRTDTFLIPEFLIKFSEIDKTFLSLGRYFNPLVSTKTGVFIFLYFNFLAIKSIPGKLNAITKRSNFSSKRSLENFLNFNLLGSLIKY